MAAVAEAVAAPAAAVQVKAALGWSARRSSPAPGALPPARAPWHAALPTRRRHEVTLKQPLTTTPVVSLVSRAGTYSEQTEYAAMAPRCHPIMEKPVACFLPRRSLKLPRQCKGQYASAQTFRHVRGLGHFAKAEAQDAIEVQMTNFVTQLFQESVCSDKAGHVASFIGLYGVVRFCSTTSTEQPLCQQARPRRVVV